MFGSVLVTTTLCFLSIRISVATDEEDHSMKTMYVQEGKFTHMNCKISNRALQSVSWIRKNDSLIIGVDEEIFINDSRFAAQWNDEFHTYSLLIKNTKRRDSGLYECQISGWPKQMYYLEVVVPSIQILTASELFIWCGSDVNITCKVSNFVEKPEEIIWFFSNKIIRPDKNINITEKFYPKRNFLISIITIVNVDQRNSGNYTCYPVGMKSSTASVSVVDGENRAAMRRSRSVAVFNNSIGIRVLLTLSTMLKILEQGE